jgi:hypothetical protein
MFMSTVKLQVTEKSLRAKQRIEAEKEKLSEFASNLGKGSLKPTAASNQQTEANNRESAFVSEVTSSKSAGSRLQPSTITETNRQESALSPSPASLRKRRTKTGVHPSSNGRRSYSYRASYTVNKRTPPSSQWSNNTEDYSAYLLTSSMQEEKPWSDARPTNVHLVTSDAKIRDGVSQNSENIHLGGIYDSYSHRDATGKTEGARVSAVVEVEAEKRAFDERANGAFDNARLKLQTKAKGSQTQIEDDSKPGVLEQKAAHVWEFFHSWDILVV